MTSDDDLLLYYYRDGLEPEERARIGAELAANPDLAKRLQTLVNRLDAVAATPDVPVPAAVQQRWSAALDAAAAKRTTATPRTNRSFIKDARWHAAAAAVLFVAIVSVLQFNKTPPAAPPVANVTPPIETPAASTGAYERGLQSHLASSEQQLASLENATPEERVRLIDTIVEQNRIFALAADRAGEPQLARTLRAFSPVLENMKKPNGDASAGASQLAFEYRVMQGRLAASAASTNQSTTL